MSGREAFIRAETCLLPVPLCPEIRLHLAEESIPLWRRTEEELEQAGLPPPFWAFAWAGGQALARYVLDHPETVRGRRVLDLAAGSGLVAIAAMQAGAASALAADIDAFAEAAARLNAAANGVPLATTTADLVGTEVDAGVILAGDIAYERDTAARVFAWLFELHAQGRTVLVGDPGRSYLPKDRLEPLATYDAPVTRELEDAETKRSTVWRLRGLPASSLRTVDEARCSEATPGARSSMLRLPFAQRGVIEPSRAPRASLERSAAPRAA